jgi:hypothetical protein
MVERITRIQSTHESRFDSVTVAEGDGLQTWRGATNVLNKQSRTADKCWSSRMGVWPGVNNSSKTLILFHVLP